MDAYTKTQFLSDVSSYPTLRNQFANSLEPPAHFYYPGGNIGGPINFAVHRLQQKPQEAFLLGWL